MEDINLRVLVDEDINLLNKWLYKPHVAKWFIHPDHWLEEVRMRNDEFNWIHHFIVEDDGIPIGFCQYYEYELGGEDWHGNIDTNETYSIDYLIGKEDYLGKKIGQNIVLALEKEIKNKTNAMKIIVQPEPENHASRKTLINAGYIYDHEYDLFYKNI